MGQVQDKVRGEASAPSTSGGPPSAQPRPIATDALGRELQVGDRVVWGAGGRRSHGIRWGTITAIVPSPYAPGLPYVKIKGAPGIHGNTVLDRLCVRINAETAAHLLDEGTWPTSTS